MSFNYSSKRFNQAASHVPLSVAEATVNALESFYAGSTNKPLSKTTSQAVSIVLTRAMKALSKAVKETHELENIACASSDLEVILALLRTPQIASELKQADPLAPAKLRSLEATTKLATAEGGCVSGEAAAKLVGLTRQSIDKARKEGRLIGLPRGQKKFIYPIWQFDKGHVLSGLKEVYANLPTMGPWAQAAFMLSPNSCLGDKSPLKVLRSGNVAGAVEAAKEYGAHGAI